MRLKVKIIFILLISFVKSNSQNIFPFSEEKKWFYVDTSLKPISKKYYSFVFPFIGQRGIVCQKGKYGVIDEKENFIIPCKYDTLTYDYPYFHTVLNKKPGTLNMAGKEIQIPLGGCGGTINTERSFWTYRKNGKIGLLDFRANPPDSLPNVYDELREYNSGIAFAKKGKKWGTINSLGKVITDFSLDSVFIVDFSDRDRYKLIKYISNGKVGFINGYGKIISPPIYKEICFNFGEFTLVSTTNGRAVYIDWNGRKFYN